MRPIYRSAQCRISAGPVAYTGGGALGTPSKKRKKEKKVFHEGAGPWGNRQGEKNKKIKKGLQQTNEKKHPLRHRGPLKARGPRRGPRIQKGGGFVHSGEGGGGSYRNFRSGSKLLQGPGQINKQKKIADSRRGGFDHPQKNLYPRLGP